jgi:hypothetical protein
MKNKNKVAVLVLKSEALDFNFKWSNHFFPILNQDAYQEFFSAKNTISFMRIYM